MPNIDDFIRRYFIRFYIQLRRNSHFALIMMIASSKRRKALVSIYFTIVDHVSVCKVFMYFSILLNQFKQFREILKTWIRPITRTTKGTIYLTEPIVITLSLLKYLGGAFQSHHPYPFPLACYHLLP